MRKVLLGLLTGLLVAAGAVLPGAEAVTWAPLSTAKIHPGVQMVTQGAQCTANFVFTDERGRVYVGYAAHCAGLGSSSDTDGCKTKSLPLGTPVDFVTGSTLLSDGTVVGHGRLAYSSWNTMQALKVTNKNKCAYNDFALVRVVKADRGKVNPSVPYWGGPTALNTTGLATGATIYSYGNSSLRGGLAGNAKSGNVLGTVGNGWAYDMSTDSPGIPGDSGSGFLDRSGRAVGVLSTLSVGIGLPPVANTMGDLYHELTFARRNSGIAGLRLAQGTKAFSAG